MLFCDAVSFSEANTDTNARQKLNPPDRWISVLSTALALTLVLFSASLLADNEIFTEDDCRKRLRENSERYFFELSQERTFSKWPEKELRDLAQRQGLIKIFEEEYNLSVARNEFLEHHYSQLRTYYDQLMSRRLPSLRRESGEDLGALRLALAQNEEECQKDSAGFQRDYLEHAMEGKTAPHLLELMEYFPASRGIRLDFFENAWALTVQEEMLTRYLLSWTEAYEYFGSVPFNRPYIGVEEQRVLATIWAATHFGRGDRHPLIRRFEMEALCFEWCEKTSAILRGEVSIPLHGRRDRAELLREGLALTHDRRIPERSRRLIRQYLDLKQVLGIPLSNPFEEYLAGLHEHLRMALAQPVRDAVAATP